MDGLEDKAGYIFDPEQMMVDFGNGMGIGITVPQLVAMKVYEQPVPQRGVDTDPPKGPDYDQKKLQKIMDNWSDEDIECFNRLTPEEQKVYLEAISREGEITETLNQIVLDNGGSLEGLENRIKTPSSVFEKAYVRPNPTPVSAMNDIIRYTETQSPENLVSGVERTLESLEIRDIKY